MSKGEEFRANAVDCMRLAGAVTDSITRLALLQMASAWRRLADHVDLGKLYEPGDPDAPNAGEPNGKPEPQS